MNILFDMNHPAHVHLFRNAIQELSKQGHHIVIASREKEVTTQLLQYYQLPYLLLSKAGKGILGLGKELIVRQLKLIPILLKNKIQLCISVTGASSIHIARLMGIPYLIFHDSESAELQNALTYPFATKIYTPESYHLHHGKKHVKYAGYHELAYLHPKRFQPDPEVLNELGVKAGEKFFVCRFVAWSASHDVGRYGFNLNQKLELLSLLQKEGKVFITSEKPLEKELEPYRIRISPHRLLDILYYATLLITDSQTVTTEAALLGTPAIRYNSFVGPNDMGNFIELERKYDLIYSFRDFAQALAKMKELLKNLALKQDWQKKREELLKDKIDVTDWMVDRILSYQKKESTV
ncbi:MAG: DUF354 domain-containing protein [Candidatus Omnitrophica bacterium]|nr:DUF354 domain-containing protein [Candidatus Omnitrophota bacterium]